MRYTVHEILDFVSKEKSLDKKVEILLKNNSKVLQDLLRMNFSEDCKWDLPDGTPPFKTDKSIPLGMGESNIYVEARRLYIFMPEKVLPKMKKEMLFIQMLEGLHYTEAEMLCAVKDHELQKRYKGLTDKVVRAAFPGLLPEVEKKSKKQESETGSSV